MVYIEISSLNLLGRSDFAWGRELVHGVTVGTLCWGGLWAGTWGLDLTLQALWFDPKVTAHTPGISPGGLENLRR